MTNALFQPLIPGTTVQVSNVKMVVDVGILDARPCATVQLDGRASIVQKISMIVLAILVPSMESASITALLHIFVNASKVGEVKLAIPQTLARN